MALTATFDAGNSRVELVGTGIPEIPGMDVLVQRRSGGADWVGVRNGYPVEVSAGGFTIYDYEFTPNELNEYRVQTDFVWDDFETASANSWGSAGSGGTYTQSGGTAADWDKAAGVGTYVMTSATGTVSRQTLQSVNATDVDMRITVSLDQAVTGGGLYAQFRVRGNTGNEVVARVRYDASGLVDLFLYEGGSQVAAANDVFAVTPGDTFSVRLRAVGRNYLAKLWRSTSDEPNTWNITYTSVNNPVGGRAAVEAARESGNTNTNPVLTFNNYHIADLANINPQVDDLGTDDVTPLQTAPWLKFPLRPFLNREVTLCNWGDEVVIARGGVFYVLGRRRPIAVTDNQASRQFPIVLRAQDDVEKEAIELALSFGDILLVQTPGQNVECTLARRSYPRSLYAKMEDVTYTRPVDGRPLWMVEIPLIEVDAPDPSLQGTTVTWQGIINAFATWQDVINAFATWQDVMAYQSAPDDEVVG